MRILLWFAIFIHNFIFRKSKKWIKKYLPLRLHFMLLKVLAHQLQKKRISEKNLEILSCTAFLFCPGKMYLKIPKDDVYSDFILKKSADDNE